jgi:flagellar protein FlaG
MVVQPITISGKSPASPHKARPPVQREIRQSENQDVRTGQRLDKSQLEGLAADAQKNMNMIHNVDLQFSVHEASGEIMVTVRNESTGEIIREIPPSETLNLAAKIDAMIGLIFDQKG